MACPGKSGEAGARAHGVGKARLRNITREPDKQGHGAMSRFHVAVELEGGVITHETVRVPRADVAEGATATAMAEDKAGDAGEDRKPAAGATHSAAPHGKAVHAPVDGISKDESHVGAAEGEENHAVDESSSAMEEQKADAPAARTVPAAAPAGASKKRRRRRKTKSGCATGSAVASGRSSSTEDAASSSEEVAAAAAAATEAPSTTSNSPPPAPAGQPVTVRAGSSRSSGAAVRVDGDVPSDDDADGAGGGGGGVGGARVAEVLCAAAAAASSSPTAGAAATNGGSKGTGEGIDDDELRFSAGVVQVTYGKLHLFRDSGNLNSSSRTPTATVCILAVPLRVSLSDLCAFTAPVADRIQRMRVLRQSRPSGVYSVLLTFEDCSAADSFFKEFNGRRFNSFDHEYARVVYVADVVYESSDGHVDVETGEPAPAGAAVATESNSGRSAARSELPTCPVCLERLDSSSTGVLTTLCNHSFHCSCLRRWEDSSCPVCRFAQESEAPPTACTVCGEDEKLWMCLVCGHVGCGRYSNEHAKAHFEATAHTYAMELETQRVWDYAGDGYVHRLITNKHDGKLVEFPDPHIATGERSQVGPATDVAMDEAVVHKMSELHDEYNTLLVSQLEAQRDYFERRLSRLEGADVRARSLAEQLAVAKREARAAERRAAAVAEREATVREEAELLRTLNSTLMANQEDWRRKMAEVEAERKTEREAAATRIAELEEQVRDVMVFLDTQRRVEEHPDAASLRESAVVGVADAPPPPARRKGRKGRGK